MSLMLLRCRWIISAALANGNSIGIFALLRPNPADGARRLRGTSGWRTDGGERIVRPAQVIHSRALALFNPAYYAKPDRDIGRQEMKLSSSPAVRHSVYSSCRPIFPSLAGKLIRAGDNCTLSIHGNDTTYTPSTDLRTANSSKHTPGMLGYKKNRPHRTPGNSSSLPVRLPAV